MAHVGLADVDGAFRWLDRACARRDPFVHTVRAARAFDTLHADPRWEMLLQRPGLGSRESDR